MMTDQQFEALRDLELRLIRTTMADDLHVRDTGGQDWLLTPAGDLEPYRDDRAPRANP